MMDIAKGKARAESCSAYRDGACARKGYPPFDCGTCRSYSPKDAAAGAPEGAGNSVGCAFGDAGHCALGGCPPVECDGCSSFMAPRPLAKAYAKDEYLAMPGLGQIAAAYAVAAVEARKISSAYDPATTVAERQSMHPDDWHLWSVAMKKKGVPEELAWTAWTLNMSTASLCHGHYDMPRAAVLDVFAVKRGHRPSHSPATEDAGKEDGYDA